MTEVRQRGEPDTRGLFSSGETSDNHCEMEPGCVEVEGVCVCETGPLDSEAAIMQTPADALTCECCGKNRVVITRYSEGYGTEEECVLSDPQGDSDADADIEDTDCRLQEPGSLQRISSRRRRRAPIARQDTTESEDDSGRSHRSHRGILRVSPHRAHSRTIQEESVSQVRPLLICRSSGGEVQRTPVETSASPEWPMSLWESFLSLPLILLLSLPLSLSLVMVIISFLLPPSGT